MKRYTSAALWLLGIPALGLTAMGCQSSWGPPSARAGDGSDGRVPLFKGLGDHRRPVTTSSPLAQRYFDQALIWTFAFNHDEAIRAYTEAARIDPDCAMAWWGIAYANGPHINKPEVDADRAKAAWDAVQKAISLSPKASELERSLIAALGTRYSADPTADRKPLDEAYAKAMAETYRLYPNDADVACLYAESLMDLRPWDLWTKEGKPHPGTTTILATLEQALRINPKHPGANHLYIHATESSPNPEKGVVAADRLHAGLVPAAGHLVHMPAHTFCRVGRWADACDANVRAKEADKKYREVVPNQGFYRLYMAHNPHFLAWASMMEGRSAVSLAAAREVINGVPAEYLKANPFMDGFMTIELESLMRFGRWDDILKTAEPPTYLPVTRAMRRFARGVAYAAKADVAGAERERELFNQAVTEVPKDTPFGNNKAEQVLAIAAKVLNGEIAYSKKSIDAAVAELGEAVKLEDQLKYNESPDWIVPARHALGAILVDAGRYAEAEKVYRDDLAVWPNNGWALYGLARTLRAAGSPAEAAAVQARFEKVWSRADVTIGSSCLCVPAKS